MSRVNVRLSLPQELIREARHLAVDQNLSLSAFLSALLEEHLIAVRQYRAAYDRQRRMLAEGRFLGTYGKAEWGRDSLHER